MKLGRTLVICALFSAAVLVFIFQSRIDKDIREIIPDEVSRSFFLAPDEQIIRIEILDRVKKTETALDLFKTGWVLTEPVSCPADLQTAGGLVTALRIAAKRTRVRAEKDWNEYGLEKPALEVTLATDKKRKASLAFGIASPVGTAVYARWVPERGFIFLPPEMKAIFESSLFTLREKKIFRIPPGEIRKVSIEMGSHSYQWKKEGGKWYWFEPVDKFGKELPAARMQLVLQALSSLYVKEFLDNPPPASQGEARPSLPDRQASSQGGGKSKAELGFYVIHDRIKLEGELGAEEVFHFGNEVPESNAYYGMKESEEEVFLVDRVNVFRLLDILRAVENENAKLSDNVEPKKMPGLDQKV